MFGNRRRFIVAGIGIVAAGACATAVLASRADDGNELISAIDEAALMQVAEVEAADGVSGRGVYVQLTKTGHLCVWEAPSATSRERGGGCNTVDDPLNGSAVSATLSYEGGPTVSDVRSASVFGLTGPTVARLSALMSDASSRSIKLKRAKVGSDEFQAFGYRFRKSDLRKGIGPVAIVAYDASGVEVGRQPTGIGG
jgi:hypothetical protein